MMWVKRQKIPLSRLQSHFITVDLRKFAEQQLTTRDGFGVWGVEKLSIKSDTDSEFLLMEVPMTM
jgi:hypothetical protein